MLNQGFLFMAAFTLTGRCVPTLIPSTNVSLDIKLELYTRETPPVPDVGGPRILKYPVKRRGPVKAILQCGFKRWPNHLLEPYT